MAKKSILRFLILSGVLFLGCSNPVSFSYYEDSGLPPELGTSSGNPLEPDPDSVPPGYVAQLHDESFTQGGISSEVDIVWMIDNSGSMLNNQTAVANNASVFTDQLKDPVTREYISFRLVIVTSDPDNVMPTTPSGCTGLVITGDNASQLKTCAVIGSRGSGREEGLESVRRALDGEFSLRSTADLQIIYVSDEEDQPDTGSWPGQLTGTTDFATLVDELKASVGEPPAVRTQELIDSNKYGTDHLADGGQSWDSNYAFVPTTANHVNFLKSLKEGTGKKVRTHAVVTNNLNGGDECHKRNNTEEIGKRYMLVAQDPEVGGSVTDIVGGTLSGTCGDWTAAMEQLGLQASGLDKCFVLGHQPIPYSAAGIQKVTVAGESVSFTYYPYGNKVCPDTPPSAGSEIVVYYYY